MRNPGHLRACSVQAMARHIDTCDRKLRKVSAHHALLFRERMYSVLSAAPRVSSENSRNGFLEVETVWEIQRDAVVFIEALRLDVDFRSGAPFLHTSN